MTGGPVFVAGLERSGTSLMYALLASHPSISMTRRTNFWRYFAHQYGDLADDANLDECLSTLRAYKRIRALDLDFDELRAEFVAGPRTYGRLFAAMQDQVARRAGKTRWGDKSLDSERYTEQLRREYPDARILHMVRDPRDRLASVLARWGTRRGALGAGTAAWLWSVRLGREHEARHPSQYRVVRYESLVTDPEAELRAICEFIGEPYAESMLVMAGGGRFREQGSNSSYGSRPAGMISPDSIGKFQDVLTDRQVAFIEQVAGAEMDDLGYPRRSTTPASLGARLRTAALERPYHEAVMALWRARDAWRNRVGRALPEYRLVEEAS